MRAVTFYQISTSDLRSIGVAQAAATICAAIGTFALSNYLDFRKDIMLAENSNEAPPQFLYNVTDLSFWAWVVFWGIAILAFLWQGNELRRIKMEHGEQAIWQRIKQWWAAHGAG